MKRLMKKFFTQLMSDERGQSTTEYILILAVVVMVAMKFKQTFSTQLGGLISQLGQDMTGFNNTGSSN